MSEHIVLTTLSTIWERFWNCGDDVFSNSGTNVAPIVAAKVTLRTGRIGRGLVWIVVGTVAGFVGAGVVRPVSKRNTDS